MEQLLKQEKKFKNLVELYAEDIKNGKDVENAIQKYQHYTNKLEETKEEIYKQQIETASSKPNSTMEEEKERLTLLVSIIKERRKERKDLRSDYSKIMTLAKEESIEFSESEQHVQTDEEEKRLLDEYEDRISLIAHYVKRKTDIISLEEKINIDNIQLEEAKKVKEQNIKTNEELELDLNEFFFESFKNIDEISKEENKEDISLLQYEKTIKELLNLQEKNLKELNSKNKKSPNKEKAQKEIELKKEEIEKTKLEHFQIKERIYLLSIIQLLATKDTDYSQMLEKRKSILQLLNNRNALIKKYKLNIENEKFNYLNLKVKEQYETVSSQEQNLLSIDKLTMTINKTNKEKENLEQLNNQGEYEKLKKEFENVIEPKVVEVDTNIVPPYEEIKFPIWESERPLKRSIPDRAVSDDLLPSETATNQNEGENEIERILYELKMEEPPATVQSETEEDKVLEPLKIDKIDTQNEQSDIKIDESNFIPEFEEEQELIKPNSDSANTEIDEVINQILAKDSDEKVKLTEETNSVNKALDEIITSTKQEEVKEELKDEELDRIMAYIKSSTEIPKTMNIQMIITKAKSVLKQISGMFKKESAKERFEIDKDGNIVDPTVKRRTLE